MLKHDMYHKKNLVKPNKRSLFRININRLVKS